VATPVGTSVRVERDGPVTVVTIDRPEVRNAVDRRTAQALADAFRAFDDDDTAAVAILTGAGGTFCAGADLKAVAAGDPNRVESDGDGPMGPTRLALSKPVIAAVEGHAVAGGLELAIWADLRVAARDAVFGVFCRRWGVPLVDGGTVRLPRPVRMLRDQMRRNPAPRRWVPSSVLRRSCSALTPIALLRDRPVKQQLHLGLEVATMSPQRADGSQLPRLCPSRHCLRVYPKKCRHFGRCEQRLCVIRSHCHEAPLGLFAMNCVLCVFVLRPTRAPQLEAAA